jgi:cell division protein FtsQ
MMPDAEPVTEDEVIEDEVIDAIYAGPGASTVPDTSNPEPPDRARSLGRHDRIRKISAIVFIVTVLLGAAAVTLTRSPFFYARQIQVRGTSHLARADVLRIAGITPKTNVFTLDAGAAEARLEREPWIAGATITKGLPSRLVIDIHERVAVAVVESGGILRLVADDGALLEAALPRVSAGLPVIAFTDRQAVGSQDAVGGAARAIAAMAPILRHRIDGVSILSDGQLRVDLSSGAEVAYGEAVELSEKAMALRALLDYADGKGVGVISADVRVPSAPTAVLSGGAVVTP